MPVSGYQWVMTTPGAAMERHDAEFAAQDGEVIVKIAGCGVCHTDLGFHFDGVRTNVAAPLTLGHEISGHVVEAGPGAESWVGQAVIIPAVIPCGTCDLCQRGHGTICRSQKMPGNDIQGGFASHITVPAEGLCPVDEAKLAAAGLDLADVSVVADALTTPYQAAVQAGVEAGDFAIIIGVGGVGGYCAQVTRGLGATVVVIDIDQGKLDALVEAGIAAAAFNAKEIGGRDLKKAIREVAKTNGCRSTEWKIFECSGSAAGQESAYGLLVHGASLAVVGFTMDKVNIRLSNLMAFHARAMGNWGCAPELYPEALDMVLDGRVSLKPFVESRPLSTINAVFDEVHGHKLSRRAILIPESP